MAKNTVILAKERDEEEANPTEATRAISTKESIEMKYGKLMLIITLIGVALPGIISIIQQNVQGGEFADLRNDAAKLESNVQETETTLNELKAEIESMKAVIEVFEDLTSLSEDIQVQKSILGNLNSSAEEIQQSLDNLGNVTDRIEAIEDFANRRLRAEVFRCGSSPNIVDNGVFHSFTGLKIGTVYRVTVNYRIVSTPGNGAAVTVVHNGNRLSGNYVTVSDSSDYATGGSIVFEASSSTVELDALGVDTTVFIVCDDFRTYFMLEEMLDHDLS